MKASHKQKWRFLLSGPGNVFFQMALDDVLARNFADGATPPVFRIYQWLSPAITVGFSQRPAAIIDLAKCAADGIEVTRRLTGGRAVFHVNEIGYTVVGSTSDPVFGGGIMETYRIINTGISNAFRAAGVQARMQNNATERLVPAEYRRTAPCFASPTKFELTRGGRKMAAGAQRRFKGIFLQQGSIRLGSGAARILEYLRDPTAARIFERELSDGGRPDDGGKIIDREQLTDAFFHEFSRLVRGKIEPDELTERERCESERLSVERYRSKGWVRGDEGQPDF